MWMSTFITASNPAGKPILSVIGKRTYTISPGATELVSEQIPLVQSDIFENPDQFMYSEVLSETDLVAYKATTDVIVQGKVCTPRGRMAYHLDASVAVGQLKKTIRAFGNRKVEYKALRGFVFSEPEPFSEIILGYKNAYGGIAKSKDGTLYSFYPNPIGKGFTIRGGFEDPSQIILPNLEDPDSPVSPDNFMLNKFEDWTQAPKPASMGYTRRNFYPRYTYAGVLPEQLEQIASDKNKFSQGETPNKIPVMDFRVYQGASDGLWGVQLKGNETVQLTYLDSVNSQFDFQLPGDVPVMSINIGSGPRIPEPVLHTVAIDMESKLVSMVWRGAVEYGGLEELAQASLLELKVESKE